MIALPAEHVPADEAMDTSTPFAGSVNVTATFVAFDGPTLLTVAVYVEFAPVAVPPLVAKLIPKSAFTLDRSFTTFERTLNTPAGVRNARPFVPQRVRRDGLPPYKEPVAQLTGILVDPVVKSDRLKTLICEVEKEPELN